MFVVKIPLVNGLGKTQGCEKASNAILENFKEIHSNEQNKLISIKDLDLEEIHVDSSNVKISNSLIYKNSFKIFETKPKVVFIGGDHSISFSIAKAFLDLCENSGKEPCLIVFDSHADCMPSTKEPTNEEWLRGVIESGFPARNILLVGARNITRDEMDFLKRNKIRLISMNQIRENIEDSCDIIMEFSSGKELYVSLDIDIIDPAFAPGTGCLEAGGFSSREIIYIIQRINKIKNLRGIDIVEVNPEKDLNSITVKLGAKLLGEMI